MADGATHQINTRPDQEGTFLTYFPVQCSITQPSTDPVAIPQSFVHVVPVEGDFLNQLSLKIHLPRLSKPGTYASWVNYVGWQMFEGTIDIALNGRVLDKIRPEFEMMSQEGGLVSTLPLQGQSKTHSAVVRNAVEPLHLDLPLRFWCTTQLAPGFPLYRIGTRAQITVKYKIKPLSMLMLYGGDDTLPVVESEDPYNVSLECIQGMTSYTPLLRYDPQDWTIQQTMKYPDIQLPENTQHHTVQLCGVTGDVQYFMITFQELDTILSNHGRSSDQASLLLSMSCHVDSHLRWQGTERVLRQDTFTISGGHPPNRYFYLLPFTTQFQRTGALNVGHIQNVQLTVHMRSNNPQTHMRVYARLYRDLHITTDSLEIV